MTHYVGLDVRIHVSTDHTPEEMRQIVEDLLRAQFPPLVDGDVEVELIESAG